ncbi:MAG: peptidoglycan DD-metalloendopeptidase family protein [Candidatus Sumerlaeaceae bacterium]|nr:peptidoglycan DD-metalloendopeptidase family protein [Candidatus Sumerlaeaceae bacterium]
MSRASFGLFLAFGLCATNPLLAAPASDPPAFGWPYDSPNTKRMTAGFDLNRTSGPIADWTGYASGEATAGSGHAYDNHSGTDSGLVTGSQVFATAAGTVNALREVVPNDDHSDTGNYLILDHTGIGGRNYRTRYWHLSQNGVLVSTGNAVTKAQYVADSDNTGNSTGPHLHYAISLLPGDSQTCGYYHAWFENDEFYVQDAYPCLVYINIDTSGFLNTREGNSTAYNIFTTLPQNNKYVATQRNGWWRLMLPLPPTRAYEARTNAGALAAGYTETGTWANDANKTAVADAAGDANQVTLAGLGSRSSTFATTGDAADTAKFSFTAPNQRGNYDIYATWASDANAKSVTYRIVDSNGTTDVLVDQRGDYSAAGTGTKANPYRINKNPYVANHTTVGAPSEWASYSPTGAGIPENGPENLYRFDLRTTADVTVAVSHSGYPTKDIDVHLLTGASNTACIQRADFSFTASALAPGTYYIAADSYGSGAAGANAATAYTLTVTFSETEPFPNSWVKLGSFFYTPGAAGSVELREGSVTGKVDATAAAKVYADAIRVVPRITRRTAWASDAAGLTSRINTGSTPVTCVVIRTDKTTNYDSDDVSEYAEVPIYSAPSLTTTNTNPIVGKAVTGQRFVSFGRAGDWYKVYLTNGTSATEGWILGDNLIAYRQNILAGVSDWSLY